MLHPNIFGYSFVNFWTTEYIQILDCKFSKIQIYLNICPEPYFNLSNLFLMKKVKLYSINAAKVSSVKFYLEEA